MRNFRTAAVAAATAASVAFAGTSVAFAAEAETENTSSSDLSSAYDQVQDDNESPTLSSKWGKALDKDDKVTGEDLLGEEKEDDTNPAWAKVWRDSTYAALGTAIAGALFAAYNFAVHNNIVPAHLLDPIFRR